MGKVRGDFIVILVGRALQVAYSLIAMRLATTLLGPAEMGRMNLVLSVISWFALLFISPAGNYVFRQVVEWNLEGRLLQELRRFGAFLGVVAVVAVILLALVHSTVGIGTPMGLGWLLWLVATSLLLGTLNGTLIPVLNTLGFRTWFVLLSNLTSWVGLGAALLLTGWRGNHVEYWMSGLLTGQVGVLFLSGWVIYQVAHRPSQALAKSSSIAGFNVRSVFSFSWPLVISTGFYWIQSSGYRFVLVKLTDVATIGLFTTGMAIAVTPLAMFDTLFTEYYRPIFYQGIAYGDQSQKAQAWNRYARAYFPAIVLMGTFIAFSGPFLARVLVSAEFRQVSWLAFWGALVQSTLMVYATYVSFTFASLDTRALIRPNILGAVGVLGGLLLLTRWQSLQGTAIALFLGMLATMLDAAFQLGRGFALRFPWRRIGLAGLLSLPLGVALEGARQFWPVPTLFQAFITLMAGGTYVAIAQLILAREWLFQQSGSTIKPGLAEKVSVDAT